MGVVGKGRVFGRFFRSGLYRFHIRTKLVHDFILRDCLSVVLRFVDAAVVLVEVEDLGGDKKMFPANVGNGFLHILLNEPSPIDWLDSGDGSEQGIRHGDAEALQLLRTEDW